MPKYTLVEEAARHCWSKNFMGKSSRNYRAYIFDAYLRLFLFFAETFRQFYADNAEVFYDAPQEIGGEQNLEYYSLFQKYLKLYEDILQDYIESLNVSVTEFYRECADVMNDPEIKDKKLLYFVEYLIASADYPSFYKVMTRAAKKLRAADQRAESKTGGESKSSGYDVDAKSPCKDSK